MTSDQPNRVKTIFLVVPQGFAARYLLQTDIFPTLRDSGHRIVLLTPEEAHKALAESSPDNVSWEKLETEKAQAYIENKPGQRFLRQVRFYVLNKKADLASIDDHYEVFLAENKNCGIGERLSIMTSRLLINLLRSSAVLRKLLLAIEAKLYNPGFHEELFAKYKPELVVTTSFGNVGESIDFFLIREAKTHGVKSVTVFLSWDNPTSKGMGGALPDNVITWTEVMKKEIISYHDFPADRISVGGVAHFDIYARKDQLPSRDEIFSKFGLDKKRKLLLFGTKSPVSYPWNPDIVRIIGSAIDEDKFIEPCQLLVRLHPLHYSGKMNNVAGQEIMRAYHQHEENYEHVHINQPDVRDSAMRHDMPKSEISDLAGILNSSDILVNMVSTLTIEAALLDVPIVNVSFEGDPKRKIHPRQNIDYDIRQCHNQRVIKTGGVSMARDEADLIESINRYLENPSLHAEERNIIREQECGPNKGSAGTTIANQIISLL
ncbi:hypothetical protein BVX97_01015 [bacterium E08(2017)]|nr:hypothetical protein BVX97_01015 [bacterium E08(2017)]